MGTLVMESPDPCVDRGKSFIQNTAVATRWILINLEIRLKGMSDQADRTRSLKTQANHLILGTFSFLDAQIMEMLISPIYSRSGSN